MSSACSTAWSIVSSMLRPSSPMLFCFFLSTYVAFFIPARGFRRSWPTMPASSPMAAHRSSFSRFSLAVFSSFVHSFMVSSSFWEYFFVSCSCCFFSVMSLITLTACHFSSKNIGDIDSSRWRVSVFFVSSVTSKWFFKRFPLPLFPK